MAGGPRWAAVLVLPVLSVLPALPRRAAAGCASRGLCCPGRDPACLSTGWRPDGSHGPCYCDQACAHTLDCCHDYAEACPGEWPAGPRLLPGPAVPAASRADRHPPAPRGSGCPAAFKSAAGFGFACGRSEERRAGVGVAGGGRGGAGPALPSQAAGLGGAEGPRGSRLAGRVWMLRVGTGQKRETGRFLSESEPPIPLPLVD